IHGVRLTPDPNIYYRTKKSENYEHILLEAASTNDYYEAILTDPTRTEAYLDLNAFLISDYIVTKEEGKQLQQLLAGLEQTGTGGFTQTVDVLEALKAADTEGYNGVCFEIGWSLLSYYDTDIDRDRYANAATWFRYMRDDGTENGEIAAIFCDISECTTKINELHGSQVIQTQALKTQRENLWEMIQELKRKADGYDTDYRLQTWIEIDSLIDNNISDFLSVALPDDLVSILEDIQAGAANMENTSPDIQNLAEQLQESTAATILRVKSAS
ncbi:MAG: serine/threonine protein kinase, partial [Firmicutes bacterium]|nr:serine/threonine protein kinase [Bacillota bacterium]